MPFEALLKDGAVIGSKILGAVGMLTAVATGALLVGDAPQANLSGTVMRMRLWAARLLFATLCVLSAPFIQWSFYGMEHGAVAALLMVALVWFDRDNQSSRGWGSAIPVFLLETIRPEGFLAIFVFFVFRTFRSLQRTGSYRCWQDRWWLAWFSVLTALLFGYEIFGFLHFGHLFPNTAAAKAGSLSWEKIHEGIYYFSTTAGRMYLGMIGVMGLWLGCRLLRAVPWMRWRALPHSLVLDLLIYALVLTQCIFIVLVGGDWMIDFRFLSHIVPLIALLWVRMSVASAPPVQHSDDAWACRGERHADPLGGPASASAKRVGSWLNAIRFPEGFIRHPAFQILFLSIYLMCQIQAGVAGYAWAKRLDEAEERVLKGTALLLESWRNSPDDMVACSDVGRMGYYYRGRVYDWWGLATEEVARSEQAMGKIDPQTVLRHTPRFIVLYSNERRLGPDTMQRDMARHSRAFFRDPEFQSDYVAVAPFYFWEDRWHIVFERVGSVGG